MTTVGMTTALPLSESSTANLILPFLPSPEEAFFLGGSEAKPIYLIKW